MKTCSLLLKFPTIFFLMINSLCASSYSVDHEFEVIIGCDHNGLTEVQYNFDTESLLYADFGKGEVVSTLPDQFEPSTMIDQVRAFTNAEKAKRSCSQALNFIMTDEDHPKEEQDPPDSIIYPAEEVQLGVENRLICFFNHFYPPPIKVIWTKNGHTVSDGVSGSRFYPNDDQSFHQFSVLKFIPIQGDKYHCTVEHIALETPKTKIWEYNVSHQSKTVYPDVLCGVGLGVGVLGIVVGILLFIKGCKNY